MAVLVLVGGRAQGRTQALVMGAPQLLTCGLAVSAACVRLCQAVATELLDCFQARCAVPAVEPPCLLQGLLLGCRW